MKTVFFSMVATVLLIMVSCEKFEEIDISFNSILSLSEGEKKLLTANFESASNKSVTWRSDKPDIAAVNNKGEVTAKSTGMATITATPKSSIPPMTCVVAVNAASMISQSLQTILHIAGSGTLNINWGDDQLIETHTLENDMHRYEHMRSLGFHYTTLLTGKKITHLDCSSVGLYSLNVSNLTELIALECQYNYLIGDKGNSLVVSNNTRLGYLNCEWCWLPSLDVSYNKELTYLNCSSNRLTSLDVSSNTELIRLSCGANQMEAEALNALFRTLPVNNNDTFLEKTVRIGNNPGTDFCDKSIATAKGWTVIDQYD